MQNAEPPGLYCADESDGEALRVCNQFSEGLYAYEIGGVAAVPALAEKCEPNTELTIWTCTLRSGVTFHDGATLDAGDVVTTYAVQWDVEHPLHKGRDNSFTLLPRPVRWVPERTGAAAGGLALGQVHHAKGAANGGALRISSDRRSTRSG